MRVAVTGGTGFIGRALVSRLLEQGHEVKVLALYPGEGTDMSPDVHRVVGNLCEPDDRLEEFCDGTDLLFHCAGQLTDESTMRRLHVGGARALLAAAKGRVERWVQLSSIGVYGCHAGGRVDETTPPTPGGVYESTKLEADRLLERSANDLGIAWSILRPSNVFGVDMPNASIRQLVRMIERGMFFYVGLRPSNAHYVHVDDVVTALCLCGLSSKANERVYNISDDLPLADVVDTIADALGRPYPRLRCPVALARLLAWGGGWIPGFPLTESRIKALMSHVSYPVERLQSELGFRYTTGVRRGMREAVSDWYCQEGGKTP